MSDGTVTGTQSFADINPNIGLSPLGFTEFNERLVFSAFGEQGWELYSLGINSTNEDNNFSDDLVVGLYDAETEQLMQILEEGDSISANGLDLNQLNIAAFVKKDSNLSGKFGSMQVFLDGQTGTDFFENVEPYALFGDIQGDYLSGVLSEILSNVVYGPELGNLLFGLLRSVRLSCILNFDSVIKLNALNHIPNALETANA